MRFDDPNKPPALLRVRLRTRADGGRRGAPAVVIVEERSIAAETIDAMTRETPRHVSPLLPRQLRPVAQALLSAADRAGAAVMARHAPPPLSVELTLDVPSLGVSVMDDTEPDANRRSESIGVGRELLYARLAGVRAAALARAAPTDPERAGSLGERGDPFATLREASLSLRVSRARCDLQTPSATGRPTVFSAGGRDVPREVRRSRPRGLAASGDGRPALAVKTIVVNPRDAPGWRAQSAAMDLVLRRAPVPPAGVRSIGAVDKARVSLRAFQLPSVSARRRQKASARGTAPSWTAERVATLAARHYFAEGATQILRLVASNKLLGDPARLWGELVAAVRELRAAPTRRGAGARFRRRVTAVAAVAAAAKTILEHAKEVTG